MLARVLRVFASLSLVAAALTSAAPAQASATLGVTVAASQSVLNPGTDLAVTVELNNPGNSASSAGTLSLALSSQSLGSAQAVSDWASGAGSISAGQSVTSSTTLAVAASSTSSSTLSIPGAALSSDGIWGIQATWTTSDGSQQARTVVTVTSTPVQASVSTLFALTPGTSGTGLLSAQDLSSLTAAGGSLSNALDALAGKTVTVGIDPRILASIRALGNQAPASATAWLARLQSLNLDSFALQYADADPALQAQLGLGKLMTAGGFTDQSGLSATELAALTSWNYNHSLLWPSAGTVADTDLDTFTASGYSQFVLSSDNVSSGNSALVSLGSSSAVVSQRAASAALAQALGASTTTSWMAAINQLEAQLALLGGHTVVLAPDRVSIASGARAASTFDLIAGSPVSKANALSSVLSGPASAATVTNQPETDVRVANGQHILDQAARVSTFSVVALTPSLVTEPTHRNVLAMFGTGWVTDPSGWASAIDTFDTTINGTLNAVQVSSSSTINVLASEASIPVTVENALGVPVHVTVVVSPSNGRLVVGETVDTDISANSRVTVRLPVKARIGNGPVSLTVTLLARDGSEVGSPTVIPANVQADWEGWGAGLLAAAAALLFGFGIWRQVRRRQKIAAIRARGATHRPSETDADHE